MAELSARSLENLVHVHPNMIKVVKESIRHFDFTVICGLRDKKAQDLAFNQKHSKVQYPNSKHNKTSDPSIPLEKYYEFSDAVDIVPTRFFFTKPHYFYFQAGMMKFSAEQLGINIRWGGDWDSDDIFNEDETERTLIDLPHFELIW